MQRMAVVDLVNERRVVDLHALLAVKVGQGDEQVERVAGGKQRRLEILDRAHGRHGVEHQSRHDAPVERRPEPARAHEQRQLAAHLQVGNGAKGAGLGGEPDCRLRNHLLQLPARCDDGSISTSAFSSHRSRCASIGRSWAKARASMVPLMPPAEAPAMMSTITRNSALRPISQELEIDLLSVVFPVLLSMRSKKDALVRLERSAMACALEARTSLRISLLMPCM